METENRHLGAEDLLKSLPLHRACRDGDLGALSALLGDAVVSVSDAVAQDPLFGWTPAHWAAHNGKVECLEVLQRAGLPCDITTQGSGLTLAHVAALEGQVWSLVWLCRNGISVNAQDHMGETAAHKAVRNGSVECLHILRENGANFSLQNGSGMNVLDLARETGQGQCLEYFNAGGDAPGHMTSQVTSQVTQASHGESPFMNGAGGGRRKRSSFEEDEEGMCSDTAKRARVEDDYTQVPSIMSTPQNGHHVVSPSPIACTNGVQATNGALLTTNGTAHSMDTATNGTSAAPSQKIDMDLWRDYASCVPCCQPIFARHKFDVKETVRHQQSFHNGGAHTNGGDSDMMVDGAPTSNGHSQMNGTSHGMAMSTDGAPAMLHGAINGNSTRHHAISPRKSAGTADQAMSNGAVEHDEMVHNSVGYDSQLLESMYNYDSMPCGHPF